MKKCEAIIFDMDGCLYPLDRGSGKTFSESDFGKSIIEREIRFIQERLGLDLAAAIITSQDLKSRYSSHLSLALEHEHGISRDDFFAYTWDLDPAEFIDLQPELPSLIGSLVVQKAILTGAPKIWADRTLTHLGIDTLFAPNILSGDQDIRKPDPQAFQQVADTLGFDPQLVVSIGDQDHTDILPAKTLGMTTVRIGRDVNTAADFLAPNVATAIELLRKEGFEI